MNGKLEKLYGFSVPPLNEVVFRLCKLMLMIKTFEKCNNRLHHTLLTGISAG